MKEPLWFRDPWGKRLVVAYVVLTLLGIGASVQTVQDTVGGLLVDGYEAPVAVPGTIYVFGLLGALTYAFTSLTFGGDKDRYGVVQLGLRVIAALPLAGGVFLFSAFFVDESANSQIVNGLAFFAGLYVRLTLQSLGKLAERLHGISDGRSRRKEARTAAEQALRHAKKLLDEEAIEEPTRQDVEDAVKALRTTLDDWNASAAEVESATTQLEGLLPEPREDGQQEDGEG
ncbi:MAG: hypothetical protein V5A36_02000 [Natronomonas sp.]